MDGKSTVFSADKPKETWFKWALERRCGVVKKTVQLEVFIAGSLTVSLRAEGKSIVNLHRLVLRKA